jgi:hypothetical protein
VSASEVLCGLGGLDGAVRKQHSGGRFAINSPGIAVEGGNVLHAKGKEYNLPGSSKKCFSSADIVRGQWFTKI